MLCICAEELRGAGDVNDELETSCAVASAGIVVQQHTTQLFTIMHLTQITSRAKVLLNGSPG